MRYKLLEFNANVIQTNLSFVPIKLEKIYLEIIKKESGFDYLINIRSSSSENEIGSLKLGQMRSKIRNVAECILEVYNLNTLEIIYSRKVIGTEFLIGIHCNLKSLGYGRKS